MKQPSVYYALHGSTVSNYQPSSTQTVNNHDTKYRDEQCKKQFVASPFSQNKSFLSENLLKKCLPSYNNYATEIELVTPNVQTA